MTVASGLYVVSFAGAMNASDLAVNVASSTNKVLLVNDTHTPNFDTHNDFADITNEVSGTGYTSNSKTVGGTPTYALGNAGQVKYGWSTTVSWTSSSIPSAEAMIITTSITTGLLICCVDFGAPFTSTAGTFTITSHANGIYTIDLVP